MRCFQMEQSRSFLLSFIAFNMCALAQASTLSDLAQSLESVSPAAESLLVKEEAVFFPLKPQVLAEGHLQMGLNVLTSSQFKETFHNVDIDDFSSVLTDSDMVLVAKVAFVLPGARPELFASLNVLSTPFLRESMFDGSTLGNIDLAKRTLELTTPIWRLSFTNRTHFSEFDYRKQEGFGFDIQQAGELMDHFPFDEAPAYVTSTNAKGSDIGTYGTWGGRTVNFYYDINDRDTLLVSYKLITLRWEWKLYPFWSQIITEAPENYFNGTFKSLLKLRTGLLQATKV